MTLWVVRDLRTNWELHVLCIDSDKGGLLPTHPILLFPFFVTFRHRLFKRPLGLLVTDLLVIPHGRLISQGGFDWGHQLERWVSTRHHRIWENEGKARMHLCFAQATCACLLRRIGSIRRASRPSMRFHTIYLLPVCPRALLNFLIWKTTNTFRRLLSLYFSLSLPP